MKKIFQAIHDDFKYGDFLEDKFPHLCLAAGIISLALIFGSKAFGSESRTVITPIETSEISKAVPILRADH